MIDLKTGQAGISARWEAKVQNWLQPRDISEILRSNKATNTAPEIIAGAP